MLYARYQAYDRPGLIPKHFLVFYLCSRVDPLPYNPARHPAFVKAPLLLDSMSYYYVVLVVATTDPHSSLSACLLGLPRVTGWTPRVLEVCADLSMFIAVCESPGEAEPPHLVEFLTVRPSSRVRNVVGMFSLRADALRLLCLSRCAELVEPIRRSCWVSCPMWPISSGEPVYWSSCESCRAYRTPVHFVRVL